jgi:TolB-like protein
VTDPAVSPAAVFLSYASQDAEAAQRLCEALRAAGIEVWLDREGGLVGGDAWDRKIRDQIAACALFVPIVSANTQARKEGYFRLEWKLAEDRSHLMAKGVPFIVPVCVDGTGERGALVPDAFLAVQWTRLAGGEATPQFVARVKRLLGDDLRSDVGEALRPDPVGPIADSGHEARSASALRKAWLVAAMLGLVVLLGLALRQPWGTSTSTLPAPSSASRLPSAASLAVLPFANLSPDQENEFFADGMHDELLTALAKVGSLKVISRTSVLIYREPAKRSLTLRQIAAELGVAHVLEGSVSRAGGSVRINVKLVDAATDQQRWTDTFNLKAVTDVFQVQADISVQIARALAAAISPELKQTLARKLTNNPAAYDLYLRARRWREMWRQEFSTLDKFEEFVVAPLEKAIALDRNFAAAYAELSHVHSHLYWFRRFDPTPTRLAKAKAAVDAALRIEPALPAAHSALGYYYYSGSRDYARATAEYALALAGMPGDAEVREYLALAQRRQGLWPEATRNLERALALNPRNRSVVETWVDTLIAQRYYARAEREAENALAFDPVNEQLLSARAQARFGLDGDRERYQSALVAARLAPSEAPRDPRHEQFRRAVEGLRYAEALQVFEEPSELDAGNEGMNRYNLIRYLFAATALGQHDKVRVRALAAMATAQTETTDRREEWQNVGRLALLHAFAQNPIEARRLAARTLDLMPMKRDMLDGPRAVLTVATVHLALGDKDRALALLDQALSVPSLLIANDIRIQPMWAQLRDDPRFKAALGRAAPRD